MVKEILLLGNTQLYEVSKEVQKRRKFDRINTKI